MEVFFLITHIELGCQRMSTSQAHSSQTYRLAGTVCIIPLYQTGRYSLYYTSIPNWQEQSVIKQTERYSLKYTSIIDRQAQSIKNICTTISGIVWYIPLCQTDVIIN